MIATLTPNPCIDKTIAVQEFDIYRMNRARVLRKEAGGKGINVSRALHGLGFDTIALGFDFSDGHESLLASEMCTSGIPCAFVPVPGELRVCTKIFDESRKHTIEVNESGAPVSAEAGERLLELVVKTAGDCDFLTLSGSTPKGLGDDFYFRVAKAIGEKAPHCKVVVDAEKSSLLKALEAHPFFIKPNIHEFQGTFGVEIRDMGELDAAVLQILRK